MWNWFGVSDSSSDSDDYPPIRRPCPCGMNHGDSSDEDDYHSARHDNDASGVYWWSPDCKRLNDLNIAHFRPGVAVSTTKYLQSAIERTKYRRDMVNGLFAKGFVCSVSSLMNFPETMPGIEVEGVGPLSFPITALQMAEIGKQYPNAQVLPGRTREML